MMKKMLPSGKPSEDPRTIVFMFAGRERYMNIQIPRWLRVLNDMRDAELHIWNFCRNANDAKYVSDLKTLHPRIKVFDDFYDGENLQTECTKSVGSVCSCIRCRPGRWSEVYKIYAGDEYGGIRFVKADDDIVYFDPGRLAMFLESIDAHPERIVSASVVNNGVCAYYMEDLRKAVLSSGPGAALRPSAKQILMKRLLPGRSRRRMPHELLKWWRLCTSVEFFRLSHEFFSRNFPWRGSEQRYAHVPRTRFSINMIGFSHETARKIADAFECEVSFKDEEVIYRNFDFVIDREFVACHLHFADQRVLMTERDEEAVLDIYERLNDLEAR